MGTFTSTLLWTLAGTVLGALLSVGIPAAILWQRYKRRPDILGPWKSQYQGIEEPEKTWVSEDLTISGTWPRSKDQKCQQQSWLRLYRVRPRNRASVPNR